MNLRLSLGIPHHTVDFRDIFNREVISPFCLQYSLGRLRTPVLIATAPSSSVRYCPEPSIWVLLPWPPAIMPVSKNNWQTGRFVLKKGIDLTRDQSYFLYRLTQAQLAAAVFPLGNMTKNSVVKSCGNGLAVCEK